MWAGRLPFTVWSNGLPFWGDFEQPRPKIRKVAVIVQFDDEIFTVTNAGQPVDAFSEKAEAMKATYRALGFDPIHHLGPAAWKCLVDTPKDRIKQFCAATGRSCFTQDPLRELVIPGG